ncbi:MAG: dTMP kinase [Candidatus Margulisbacteria bacterium]|nr:dTMP kinase [Candidatus Margulisiibacteriota bacterium]MBU1022603.1 dTMP kinase [Candidatus Margulisiibacteriota bacterium]MBU1728889.1 dTMP kinase [Candidatus Margulisiibacteriota bacterium]MBU1955521.1 dTMP kinase [Candidatus Margulisiibacteriota bacterium]
MFITFEGCEGCGKTTHINLLAEYLREKGKEVLVSREPGGTPFGENLREVLLESRRKIVDRAELFLFAADRAQHVEKVIKPALNAGKFVLCDRYIDSTYAYQIGGRQLPEDLVNYINLVSSFGLFPDITFYLDVPAEMGLKRVSDRGAEINRFELEEIKFHDNVRQAYLNLGKENPKRIRIINATGSIESTQQQIRKSIGEAKA